MHTTNADGVTGAGAGSGRRRWTQRLSLVALTALVVVALVAMEALSLLLLDFLR